MSDRVTTTNKSKQEFYRKAGAKKSRSQWIEKLKARVKKATHKPKPWQNVEKGKKPGQPRELKHKEQGEEAKPEKWYSSNEAHLDCKSKHKSIYKDLDDAKKVQQLQTINIQ